MIHLSGFVRGSLATAKVIWWGVLIFGAFWMAIGFLMLLVGILAKTLRFGLRLGELMGLEAWIETWQADLLLSDIIEHSLGLLDPAFTLGGYSILVILAAGFLFAVGGFLLESLFGPFDRHGD